jgi:hypothetical protein
MTKTIDIEGYKDYLHDLMSHESPLRETIGVLLGEAKAIYRAGALSKEEVAKWETISVFNEAGGVALTYLIKYFPKSDNFVMRKIDR